VKLQVHLWTPDYSKHCVKVDLQNETSSPYRSKMALKTASSVMSYWVQTRNNTVFKRKEVSIGSIFCMKCWRVSLRMRWVFFCNLNELNTSLQGFCSNIVVLRNKTDTFKKKLLFRDSFVQKEQSYLQLQTIFWQMMMSLLKRLLDIISQHLKELAYELWHWPYYFSEYKDPRNETV